MPAGLIRLNLGKDVLEELDGLARYADRLSQMESHAAELGPRIGTAAVAREIARLIDNVPESEIRFVLAALLNFYHTQKRLKLTAAEMGEVLEQNISRLARTPDSEDKLARWTAAKHKIAHVAGRLHPDHPLEGAYKAYRVASAREYELAGMRIFTDVRPVFNDAGDAIIQSVVTHILSIDYHDGANHHVIQFSLDATDLTDLKEICERAEKKGAVIKHDLQTMPWPSTVFREPDDRTNELE